MLATAHAILLAFGIFLISGVKIPDCTQLMSQCQLCAALACFPVLCSGLLDTLDCPIKAWIISKLMAWSAVVPVTIYVSQWFCLLAAVCVVGGGAPVPVSSGIAFRLSRWLLESRLTSHTYL